MVSALCCSIKLIVSGTATAQVVLPAMLGVHLLIGIGEGLITVAAISFILTTRPDLLSTGLTDALHGKSRPLSGRVVLGAGLSIAAALALLSPLASSSPDGLERVAEDNSFLNRALDPLYNVLPDYTIPGLDGALSTILAGLVGVILVVALGYGVALLLRRRRETAATSHTETATPSR
jgi:cobalt/nickel transport system permease protein